MLWVSQWLSKVALIVLNVCNDILIFLTQLGLFLMTSFKVLFMSKNNLIKRSNTKIVFFNVIFFDGSYKAGLY